MAIFYGERDYGCGKFEAIGWDPACVNTEVWSPSEEPTAGTVFEPEEVAPIEV